MRPYSRLAELPARIRSLLRQLRRRSTIDAEMREEFDHHIELRTQELMRQGLAPLEARRRAQVEFGYVETHREHARAARGLRVFDQLLFSWVDMKLGVRMLFRHPGLTAVSLFALGIGIPLGLAPWQFFNAVRGPLPVDEGGRIRAIRYEPVSAASSSMPRATMYELEQWRKEAESFSILGAMSPGSYSLLGEDAAGRPVPGAEVTASVFETLRVPPLLGRTLLGSDEQIGGPDVVVIGYDVWQARFNGDAAVVGRSVSVSGRSHTVVGVMPEGFTFPSHEQLWMPLREAPVSSPAESTEVAIFGRLADGVSEAEAHAELGGLGRRMSDAFPDVRAGLRAEVVPFGLTIVQLPRRSFVTIPELAAVQLVALLLLFVACANVGILQLAKAATRFKEIAVRTALGASRRRILTQMFAESLVLSLGATGIGLTAFAFVYRWVVPSMTAAAGAGLPYWLDLGMKLDVAAVALGLAALSAFITGVLPALKVTGGDVQRTLQRLNGRSSGIRFGGVTTALIALDVAVTVVAVGFGSLASARLLDHDRRAALTGVPAEEYLAARIDLAPGGVGAIELDYSAEAEERLARAQEAIVERLAAEPAVHGVAVSNVLPRMEHQDREIEWADDSSSGGVHRRRLATVRVMPSFFEALDQPILLGRGFDDADLREGITPVIVNTVFVEAGLGGGNPMGRRIRFVSDADTVESRWYEIVGVVGPLGVNIMSDDGGEAIYVPTAIADIRPLRLGLHIGAAPESFIPRLRAIVNEVDPLATVSDPRALNRFWPADWYLEVVVLGMLLVGLVGVLVSMGVSALYAMMSFAISERAREIGIRTALGAERRTVALLVARRALGQIGAGVALGTPWVVWMFLQMRGYSGLELSGGALVVAALLPGIGVTVLVGILACTAPTMRALRIDPNEVLKAER